MPGKLSTTFVPGGEGLSNNSTVRPIARAEDWSVSEFLCAAAPRDRPFEERHDGFTIAAVVEGTFTYRADSGAALLHPGALLLGNHGRCFQCGHDRGAGDRCIAFNFSPDYFAEIATGVAGTGRFAFSRPMLPVERRSTPLLARVEAASRENHPLYLEELATRVAETVLTAFSDRVPPPLPPSKRESRRIADALRHIEENATQPLDLAGLAAVANVSKYHFLRIFRRATGATPYQLLLATRLRRTASRLARSSDTVTSIAFESGFGDLSTFNARFRETFGVSPTAYRASCAGERTGAKQARTFPSGQRLLRDR